MKQYAREQDQIKHMKVSVHVISIIFPRSQTEGYETKALSKS